MFSRVLFISIFLLLAVASTSAQSTSSSSDQKASVVTSTPLLADLAEQIAGEHLNVSSVLSNQVDPHFFEPGPSDITKITGADLVIIHGLGYDSWIENIPEVGNSGKLLNVGRSFEALFEDHEHHNHDHGHNHDTCGTGGDIHVWMDPENVQAYLDLILEQMVQKFPEHATSFESRHQLYSTKIRVLDGWIKNQIASVPPENRQLIVDHLALTWYADAYGIELRPLSDVNYDEVDLKSYVELTEWAKENGINSLLISSARDVNQFKQIHTDLSLGYIAFYYVDQLPENTKPSYEEMMIRNTLRIKEAMTYE